MAVKTSDLTVNIASQFYHSTPEPLDKSLEVEDVEDLYDNNKMPAYKGKIVHVKNGGEYGTGCSYLCTSAQVKELQDGSGLWGVVSTWQPLIEDDGSAFYFTYEEGGHGSGSGDFKVVKVTVDRDEHGQGRIIVHFPDPPAEDESGAIEPDDPENNG